ncbi:MAG: peptide chain release factor 1 [Leptolyngbyaceae cyanobacterium SM2_3_12]|nr:peptide chain release factor 1 [Leptolyngbyaceae cyanobacterium SM2_3_12]
MRNPFWRLKSLPWVPLLQTALMVVVIATLADLVLIQLLNSLLPGIPGALMPLIQLLLGALPLAAGFGMGALALVILERFFASIYLDRGVLWALVPCLALVLWLKGFLPIPAAFVSINYGQIVGLLLGIFVTGKRHWR